jgi:hypothetical protein
METITFAALCPPAAWQDILACERKQQLTPYEKRFLAHMALHPQRPMSTKQVDTADEIIQRITTDEKIDRGECVLPPTLDLGTEEPQETESNRDLDDLDELFRR